MSDYFASAGVLGADRTMNADTASADHCPHCRRPLEIIGVKFKLTGAAILSACANCGRNDITAVSNN
jgi:hypothetical protein